MTKAGFFRWLCMRIAKLVHSLPANLRFINQRKHHRKRTSKALVAVDLQLALMKLHDLVDDGQPESVSLCSMGGVALIKAVEDMVCLLLTHAAAVIHNAEHDVILLFMELKDNLPLWGRKLHCVVDQIDPDLVQ